MLWPAKRVPFPGKRVRKITASRLWSFHNFEVATTARYVLMDRANENKRLSGCFYTTASLLRIFPGELKYDLHLNLTQGRLSL